MAWMLLGFEIEAVALDAGKAVAGTIAGLIVKKVCGKMMKPCCTKTCKGYVAPLAGRYGLCNACHKRAKAKVDSGATTWEKLAELGLCTGAESNPFDDAYSQALREND